MLILGLLSIIIDKTSLMGVEIILVGIRGQRITPVEAMPTEATPDTNRIIRMKAMVNKKVDRCRILLVNCQSQIGPTVI